MKNVLYILAMVSIMSIGAMASVVNTSSGNIFTGVSFIDISLASQDPIQADPGAYVDLVFKVENRGTVTADNVVLELIDGYPFSVDGNAIVNLGTVNSYQVGSNAELVKFKARVAEDALDGDNEISLKYSTGNGESSSTVSYNISVSDPRTEFELVAQDSSTFAIANVGSKDASSVIVSVPKQEGFTTSGAIANIVGNLDSGDYTLVTFDISKSISREPGSNVTIVSQDDTITIEISYTDTLGIRRTVDKEVYYSFGGPSMMNTSSLAGNFAQRSSGSSNGLLYIVIGVAGIAAVVAVIKLKTRKKK
jgi:hypothetical protein